MSDEVKTEQATEAHYYEITVTKHIRRPTRKRDSTYKDGEYHHGPWYDTFEDVKQQVYQQSLDNVSFGEILTGVIKAVNKL